MSLPFCNKSRWNLQDVAERSFAPSFLSFLESDFVLLWCKTLHSEVAWTEENTGKSEFTLFATWLIILPRVLWCQNTIKISLTKRAKQQFFFHLVWVPSEFLQKGVSCLAFIWSRSHDHINDQSYHLQYTILFYCSLLLNATYDTSKKFSLSQNASVFWVFTLQSFFLCLSKLSKFWWAAHKKRKSFGVC